MNEALTKKLIEDFPALFGRSSFYGFECEDGWEPLIRQLSEKIATYVANLPPKMRADHYVVQVKQKFGGLRYYMSQETPIMTEAIGEAMRESFSTCEDCGKPGKRRKFGYWLYVSCDDHEKKR